MTHNNLDQGSPVPGNIGHKLLEDGYPGKDDAGHCIANRLGGLGNDLDNLFPQNCHVNRGKFKSLEGKVYKILKENKDWEARIEVQLHYSPNQKKPRRPRKYSFVAKFFQNGTYKKQKKGTFSNTVPQKPCYKPKNTLNLLT